MSFHLLIKIYKDGLFREAAPYFICPFYNSNGVFPSPYFGNTQGVYFADALGPVQIQVVQGNNCFVDWQFGRQAIHDHKGGAGDLVFYFQAFC